jgi:hypothetical protein
MKLTIPALPPILAGSDVYAWRKWFAFWMLPLEYKADLIDRFPSLVIERLPPPETTDGMQRIRKEVYFDPSVFDTQISETLIFNAYDHITYADTYPTQSFPEPIFGVIMKNLLYDSLYTMHFAVLAYKYRYLVRPERYYFGMDYELALFNTTTETELSTFYASPNSQSIY